MIWSRFEIQCEKNKQNHNRQLLYRYVAQTWRDDIYVLADILQFFKYSFNDHLKNENARAPNNASVSTKSFRVI